MNFKVFQQFKLETAVFWQICVIAFLLLFVVILIVNFQILRKAGINADKKVEVADFKAEVINNALLEQTTLELEQKKTVLEELLSK